MGAQGCCRCGERGRITDHGPLLGLCLICIENDHIGLTAHLAEARRERDAARAATDEWERAYNGANADAVAARREALEEAAGVAEDVCKTSGCGQPCAAAIRKLKEASDG